MVLAVFVLIMVGGHTTTAGAGMAFPDWPLSHGSLNPDGWWEDLMMRLEHGHRILAGVTGLMIGILCSWVWGSKWSVPVAIVGSAIIATAVRFSGADPYTVAHAGIWPSAIIFAAMIYWETRGKIHLRSRAARWVAIAAFLGVIPQAVMGGLRVTIESGGNIALANAFRVAHGCFAQIELCLVVCLAAMLSPVWGQVTQSKTLKGTTWLAWITVFFVFLQLIAGATMRHLHAGLAIPTFPAANPDGSWWPAVAHPLIHLNFTHTRVGAVLVAFLALIVGLKAIGNAGRDIRVIRPAALLIALVAAQFTLGMFVIWKVRPPILTTLHVVNGAAVLATTVLLALRAGRASVVPAKRTGPEPVAPLTEVNS